MDKKNAILTKALRTTKWASNKSKIIFNFFTMNRVVRSSHTTEITTSIEKYGILRPIICAYLNFITGKMQLYVIDGQHTIGACIRLNIDIPYVIIPIKNHKELITALAMFNSTSKTWVLQDYITAWASLETDYIKLNYAIGYYDLEISVTAAIMHGLGINSPKSGITVHIKGGTFAIKNEKQAKIYLDYMTDVLNIVPRMDRNSNRIFIRAYYTFILENKKVYNHLKFCTFLKKHIEKFTFVNGDEDSLNDFFLTAL